VQIVTKPERFVLRIAQRATRCADAAKSFALMVAYKEDRLAHAMHYLLTTEGRTFERTLAAFRATPAGRSLLDRQPDFRTFCGDRNKFQSYPEGSLGRVYAEFMTSYGLEEEHYLDVAIIQAKRFDNLDARAWFHIRVDASHDMRHVLTGYPPDVLGELCLLSFRFAQTRHPGIPALLLLAFVTLTFTRGWSVVRPVLEAYQRGRRAKLLDLLPWEDVLAEPLSAHRAALGLTIPRHYPSSVAPYLYIENLENSISPNIQRQERIIGEHI
jgi:ubiquinone biosynthesis protein COQ4